MSDLDRRGVQRDAVRRVRTAASATRYGDAINRYIAAAGRTPEPAPSRAPVPPRVTGTVLVGVDESPVSWTAVDHAAIEAEVHGWNLLLFHVQRPGGLHPASRDDGARLLERLTDRVHRHTSSVAVNGRLAVGSPAGVLLANARGASLVVVGHRHGPAGTAAGLTVGDRVAGQHSGVVLVARIPAWPPGADFAGRPIVVGAGVAGARTPAVDFALREAAVRGCDVVVLHAGLRDLPALPAETVDGVLVHHRTVAAEPIAALIEASEKAAAVVVGRGTAARPAGVLLGPVSRALVQRAYCPVFLVG